MHPHDIVKKFSPLRHFDVYLGFGNVLISCPCLGVYSWGWSLLHGLDHVSLGPISSGLFLWSLLLTQDHHCASTRGFAVLGSHVSGLCRSGEWSRDLGVNCDLKSYLGNTHVTYRKIHLETKHSWCSIGLDHESRVTYCLCKGFIILPSKTLFLS